jgi:hypothetical protein
MESIMVHEFSNGEIKLWVENETSIHLKAITTFGDPVELNAEEAIEISTLLKKLSEEIE